jgi:hypothetical protein
MSITKRKRHKHTDDNHEAMAASGFQPVSSPADVPTTLLSHVYRPRCSRDLLLDAKQYEEAVRWVTSRKTDPWGPTSKLMVIEGGIGVGKSTLAQLLLREQGYDVITLNAVTIRSMMMMTTTAATCSSTSSEDNKEMMALKQEGMSCLQAIYNSAKNLNNIYGHRVAVVLNDIDCWHNFPFDALRKLLTVNTPITTSSSGSTKTTDPKKKKTTKKATSGPIKLFFESLVPPSSHGATTTTDAKRVTKVQQTTVVGESGTERRVWLDSMKRSLPSGFSQPLVCPIVCTSGTSLEKHPKLKMFLNDDNNIICKRIVMNRADASTLLGLVNRAVSEYKLGMTETNKNLLIEQSHGDMRQLFSLLQLALMDTLDTVETESKRELCSEQQQQSSPPTKESSSSTSTSLSSSVVLASSAVSIMQSLLRGTKSLSSLEHAERLNHIYPTLPSLIQENWPAWTHTLEDMVRVYRWQEQAATMLTPCFTTWGIPLMLSYDHHEAAVSHVANTTIATQEQAFKVRMNNQNILASKGSPTWFSLSPLQKSFTSLLLYHNNSSGSCSTGVTGYKQQQHPVVAGKRRARGRSKKLEAREQAEHDAHVRMKDAFDLLGFLDMSTRSLLERLI